MTLLLQGIFLGDLYVLLFDVQRFLDEVLGKILSVMSQKYRLVLFELPDTTHLQAKLVRALVEESLKHSRLHF